MEARPSSTPVFLSTTSSARTEAIVNVAVGGSYALTQNKVWTLYFGFTTDFSPVGDDDEYFSRVDLYGLTGGISGTVEGFTAASASTTSSATRATCRSPTSWIPTSP